MIPYDEITEAGDRRWTTRLLTRLVGDGLDDEELHSLRRALQALSDPRSFEPLEAVLLDARRPDRIRTTAAAVLRDMYSGGYEVPPETLLRWWASDDEVLRLAALRWMGGLCCPDIVRAIAADDGHPLQDEALARMVNWFDRAADVAIQIRALSHPDELIRATAAWVLVWDEPVAAEGPLLQATADPSPRVVHQAIRTLQYYPSCQVLRRLAAIRVHPNGKPHDDAEEAIGDIRDSIRHYLQRASEAASVRLRTWLAPVWELLAYTNEELEPIKPFAATPRHERTAVAARKLLAMLANPDVSRDRLLNALDGAESPDYMADERGQLRAALLAHADPDVRHAAPAILAAWDDEAGLLELLADPVFLVRKSAAYHLGKLPRSAAVAGALWAHFEQRHCLGVHATEVLRSFVCHAEPAEAIRRLAPLAEDRDQGEAIRLAAVHHLAELGAAGPLARLLPELQEPPAVTWALHLALLEAVRRLALPVPDVRHLDGVDNLYVQVALAELEQWQAGR